MIRTTGSGASQATIAPPVLRLTVIVRPAACAVNDALAPLCTIGGLIESRAITSAPAFSQRGAPAAVLPATAIGWHTRSWLTRYGRSTPENPLNVAARTGAASPVARPAASRAMAIRIDMET